MNKLCLTFSLIFCLHFFAFSQSDSTHLTTIASKLERLSATRPVEKVYLHLNKPAYNTGDTIWFKAYLTAGEAHQPSALSGVLYVELIDSKEKIIKTLQLKILNSASTGEFAINNSLLPGYYRIRAYTTWMRNAGPDYFFTKSISISNLKTGAVFIASSVDALTQNNDPVNARLTYTDKSGRPYNNKVVAYEVKGTGTDTTILYKGKATTDDKGNINIAISDKTIGNQKQVNIINHVQLTTDVTVDKTIPISIQKGTVDIQFFPEGGQLVNDVRSKVAFKAIGANGLGVDVKGVVLDNENNEVAYFSAQHTGMGIFALAPQNGKTYTAKITLANNSTITAPLPSAAPRGFVLAVNNADNTKLTLRVATNAATLQGQQNRSFYLVGQSGGRTFYATAGKLDNASFIASVPKSKFPTGIIQFTLFSSNNEPLNERVVFVQNNDLLDLNLKTTKTTYAPKEKVSMTFSAKDPANKPAVGSFSLSVFNESLATVNENTESTILSNILLTSDLKGYIEQPNYYFNQPTDQTRADLDVLMLTQGYRRFEWKEIMADRYPQLTYKPEKSLSISGMITNSSGKPVPKGKLSVLSPAYGFAADTVTDTEGKFNLTGVNLPDSAIMVVQARKSNDGKNVNILLDNNRSVPPVYKNNIAAISESLAPPFLSTPVNGNADAAQLAATLKANPMINTKDNLKNIDLKEINVNQKELAPWMVVNPRSSNLNGPGHADMVITAHDLSNCIELSECLQAKVPGVIIKGDSLYFIRHSNQSIMSPPAVLFIVDGILIGNSIDQLDNAVTVSNVETIEVLNSGSYLNMYGSSASGGALVITTRITPTADNMALNEKTVPGVINTAFKGFYKAKEFYMPKYTAANLTVTDQRTAIYWNPNIITDATGQVQLEYFNSDIKGTYRVVIEGIDNDGNIGRFVYRYKVE